MAILATDKYYQQKHWVKLDDCGDDDGGQRGSIKELWCMFIMIVSVTLQSQRTSSMSLTNVTCIFMIHMIKEYLMIFYIFVEHINAYHEKTKTNNECILHRAWYISLLCAIELCSCPQKIKSHEHDVITDLCCSARTTERKQLTSFH